MLPPPHWRCSVQSTIQQRQVSNLIFTHAHARAPSRTHAYPRARTRTRMHSATPQNRASCKMCTGCWGILNCLWPQPQNASITSSALSVCPPSRVERESCATLVGLRLTKCLLTCGMAISMAAYNTRVHPKARRPTTRRGAAK